MKILRVFLPAALLCLPAVDPGRAATPYVMSNGDYSESFTNLAIWTDNFVSPIEASRWSSVAVNPVGTIPDGQRVMRAATNFTTLTTGGVQKDFSAGARLALLSTGAVDNTNSTAIDLHLDFTGRLPGTLSYDWVTLTNSTGDRASSLRIYTSTNGSAFTELPAAAVLNKSNNVPAAGSVVAVALPATLANSPTARLRFYQYNGTGGSVGSRAKIAIDNILVTSTTTDLVVTNHADSGPGTLRQTITDISPGRTITFASSLSGANLVLSGGELVLNKNLTIDASALPGGITLDGTTNSRILRTIAGTTNLLRNLTLRGGNGVGAVATGLGGAIYNQGRLTLAGCTVAENTAGSGGGGIFTEGAASQLFMTNCTVAANTAEFAGALLIRNSSSVSLVHCTISSNTGTGGSGGVVLESSAVLSLLNSIVAGNGDDIGGCGGTLTRSGNNIVGWQPSCYTAAAPLGSPNINGDYVGTSGSPINPLLSSLGNYGGPTKTMPPMAGSPAIDRATSISSISDQRGFPRPVDGDGNGSSVADIGAGEFYLSPQITGQPQSQALLAGNTASFSVTATGSALRYQWYSNSLPILNATNSGFVISNTQSTWSGGSYSVVITNFSGSVTSAIAALTVAETLTPAFSGNWPGYKSGDAYDVQVVGPYAYVATGAGLSILNVSDAANPQLLGSYNTDTPATRIFVTNGNAWLLTISNEVASARVNRIDVQNPAFPQKKAERIVTSPTDVTVAGSYAYVADGTAVRIINSAGGLAGTLSSGGSTARAVSVSGQYLYVAWSSNDIRVYSLTNPISPLFVSSASGPVTDYPIGMTISGNRIFTIPVSGGNVVGFQVANISNPLSPSVVTNMFVPASAWAFYASVAVNSNIAYIVNGDFTGNSIIAVDVTPGGNFPVLGERKFDKGTGHRICVAGNRAYVTTLTGGLQIFDLSNPTNAVQIGQFYTAVNATDVVVQGNVAFVRDPNIGFHAVDISDPTDPTLLGTYQATNEIDAIAVMGRHVYVALVATGAGNPSLDVVDVADPEHPVLSGHIELPSLPNQTLFYSARVSSMLVHQDSLYAVTYVFAYPGLLDVISLNSPASPVVVTQLNLSFASKLAAYQDTLFAATDFYNDLTLFDISNPSNTAAISTWPGENDFNLAFNSASARSGHCYLHDNNATTIFNVAQPNNPQAVFTNAQMRGFVSMQENRAIAANSASGLTVFDTTNPTNFVEVGNFGGLSGGVALEGRYAIVAASDSGLTLLDLGANLATPPAFVGTLGNRRVLAGANTNFFLAASGTAPLSFQWRFNGTNIPGANQPLLSLTNIQYANAGQYSLLVSNAAGIAISSNALLTVDLPADVQLTTPGQNETFWPSSNIVLTAIATDAESPAGWVARVEFFNGATSLGIRTNQAPYTNSVFSLTWSNVPAGSYLMKAVATDNEGATNTSDSVGIIVTNQLIFQLSAANYPVAESNGVVTVTVKRNIATNAAEVFLTTENATAFSAPPGGVGSYLALATNLTLPAGVLSTNIAISIINDLVNRGDRQFVVRLTNASSGWSLVEPTNAYVTILDDDPLTNNFADVVLPPAVANGALQVSLLPTNAAGKWRFWWETDWRDSGSSVSNLTGGSYTLEFLPCSGFIAPASTTVNLSNGAVFLSITNYYTNLVGTLAAGSLKVTISPSQVASASEVTNRGQWRIASLGTNWLDGDVALTNLAEGAYFVEFKTVPGYQTPPAQVAVVAPSNEVIYAGNYLPVITPAANGPVPLDSYTTITNDAIQPGTPYRFSGQIFSDAGFSSGFVVKKRTVLTAAHAVFDFGRLTFATNVWWFFQRQRGEHEPLAQQPRGWQVFAGYTAARTNDPSPNESTIETRSLDVAALYFTEDAGRGGYGGYLITTTNGQWLDGAQLKLMVGYPVEGVAETNQGRMHQVGPFFAAFQRVTNQVYRTDQVFSYGGNSGGPVCVLSTNSSGRAFFIPAGIYLGGSGETVARAIDLDVVDLINRAENSSAGGTNSTGGGVVPVFRSLGATLAHPAYLSVSVGPPAAVRLGAMWRISPTNFGELGELRYYTNYTANPQTLAIRSTNFSIETIGLAGFQPPPGQPVVLSENSVQELRLLYSVNPPWLTYHSTQGLGMTGTLATDYQIEISSLLGSNWSLLPSNITLSAGTNWIPATGLSSSNRFFRARWLPD